MFVTYVRYGAMKKFLRLVRCFIGLHYYSRIEQCKISCECGKDVFNSK